MSYWTTVNGTIRLKKVDGFPDFDKIVGKECIWGSPVEFWNDLDKNPDDYMPCGSEGTLQKFITMNGGEYIVIICGNLRDFYDHDAIKSWFDGVCNKLPVKEASISMKSRDFDKRALVYKYKENK